MLTYKSNFPHEINYRGNNVTNVKYKDTSVWLAPKATGLAYFNHNILPTSGNFRFGFITTCPCRVEIRMYSSSNQQWTILYNQTWSLTNLLPYVYESAYSITTHLGRTDYEAGPNKFLHDSINVNSDIIVDAYRIFIYDSVDNTLLYDSGSIENWTTNSCTCTASPASYNTTYLNSTTVYATTVTVESYASQTSSTGVSRIVAVTPTATISNTNIITNVSFIKTAANTYRMIVSYRRNTNGSSTVTITTSYEGKTDTATFRLIVSQLIVT